MEPPHRAPHRYAPLAAIVAIVVSVIGFGVATAQDLDCEFDCLGTFDDPHVARMVQGTPYSVPAPFFVALALAAFLATRPRKGIALTGLGLLTVLGVVMMLATLGEPWAQRALAAPGGMTLALLAFVLPALGMAVFGAWGLARRARA